MMLTARSLLEQGEHSWKVILGESWLVGVVLTSRCDTAAVRCEFRTWQSGRCARGKDGGVAL